MCWTQMYLGPKGFTDNYAIHYWAERVKQLWTNRQNVLALAV